MNYWNRQYDPSSSMTFRIELRQSSIALPCKDYSLAADLYGTSEVSAGNRAMVFRDALNTRKRRSKVDMSRCVFDVVSIGTIPE